MGTFDRLKNSVAQYIGYRVVRSASIGHSVEKPALSSSLQSLVSPLAVLSSSRVPVPCGRSTNPQRSRWLKTPSRSMRQTTYARACAGALRGRAGGAGARGRPAHDTRAVAVIHAQSALTRRRPLTRQHTLSLAELAAKHGTLIDLATPAASGGTTEENAESRLASAGRNELPAPPSVNLVLLFLSKARPHAASRAHARARKRTDNFRTSHVTWPGPEDRNFQRSTSRCLLSLHATLCAAPSCRARLLAALARRAGMSRPSL